MTVQGPTVVRRQLGSRLRQMREDAGKTIQAVSAAKIFSTSKMIRIEGGKIEVKAGDVWTLCRFYGMTDPAVIDDLAVLADGTGERGWWEEGTEEGRSGSALYAGLEAGVDELKTWQAEVIPGLLQTSDYASAVVGATPVNNVNRTVAMRGIRQQRFFDRGVSMRAVLSPATLLREVGGRAVMAAQHQHLIDHVDAGRAEIKVLPWSTGAHIAMSGGFTLFLFHEESNPSVVYLESLMGGRYLEKDAELVCYCSAFDLLWETSVRIEEWTHESY